MTKFLTYTLKLFGSIILLLLLYLNIRLYYQPTILIQEEARVNQSVLHQLRYLKDYLHHQNGGEIAQAKYPEGYVFINVLYGLAWCDFIKELSLKHSLRQEGLEEISWALAELQSPDAKMWFPNAIHPSRGIFYQGWCNYLLAKKLLIQESEERSIEDVTHYKKHCALMHEAFSSTSSCYLESYVQLAWPADNIVAIASLALHDKIDSVQYQPFIQTWLEQIQQKLDLNTGLIPHEVNFGNDAVIEGARGSSQSLMLNFLMEIDSTFAQQQFEQYTQHFLTTRFGLPGIREYPFGVKGGEDVDSGPVILEVGGAASLVGQRTMAIYGKTATSVGLRNCIESFGVAYTSAGQKQYVLGIEPIADAFIVWANALDVGREATLENWRWRFQLLSLFIVLLFYGIYKWSNRHKNRK